MPRPYKITEENRRLVRALSLSGQTDAAIAHLVGCAETTIQKYFSEELKEGRKIANAKVVGALFKSAMEGNVSAQIFWCKTRLGWRETADAVPQIAAIPPRLEYAELQHTSLAPKDLTEVH